MTSKKERGSWWLRNRCYLCGHWLRFDATGCPQCGEEFDGRDAPKRFPRICQCPRCESRAGDEVLAETRRES